MEGEKGYRVLCLQLARLAKHEHPRSAQWRAHLSAHARCFLAQLWPWSLVATFFWIPVQFIFGTFLGVDSSNLALMLGYPILLLGWPLASCSWLRPPSMW